MIYTFSVSNLSTEWMPFSCLSPMTSSSKFFLIMDIYFDVSFKKTFFRFNGNGIDVESQFPGNQIRDFIHDPHIVHAHNTDPGKK